MKLHRLSLLVPTALGAAAALLAPGHAQAAPCSDLPKPVYGLGGSAQNPLVKALATRLAALPDPITIVYDSSKGACSGINGLYGATPTKMTGTASTWTAAGTEVKCDLPITGVNATWGTLGNSATLCAGIPDPLPADIGDFRGPITNVNLFVKKSSSQQSISAAGVYFAYGFGAAGQAAPWTDESVLIRRNENSFVQIYLGIATGIPFNKFKGVDARTNDASVQLVADAPDAEKAIGFASGAVVDGKRDVVRTLAYQHTGQSCGYWPDTNADASDKANVRSGLYYLWGQLHFYAKVAGGVVIDENTRKVVDWFTGKNAPAGLDLTKVAIDGGTIPECAMRAKREGDLGAISSYAPSNPCGCFFEKEATGTTTCTACPNGNECTGSQRCRFGHCEAY
jgi:hypothetical protein